MKSVLLIGQSNMAGRGFLHEVPPIYDERIWMLRNGRWQMMTEPIHFDRSVAGNWSCGFFRRSLVVTRNKNEQDRSDPCAEGGSALDEWEEGGILFRHAVSEAKYGHGEQ